VRTAVLLVLLVGCGKRNFNDLEVDAPIVTCPANYTPVAGAGDLHYGPRLGVAATWIAAQMSCINEGTRLAIPSSRYEALALVDLSNTSETWIGVSTIDSGDVWRTVYGTPATYLPWTAKEPDGTGDCVDMDAGGNFGDHPCSDRLFFICECRGQQ
jgi:hypothetical protein